MATDLNTVILWEQAVEMFEQEYLPAIRQVEQRNNGGKAYVDGTMRREEWNNFTDMLCKNNEISDWQYENWGQPDCCEKESRW